MMQKPGINRIIILLLLLGKLCGAQIQQTFTYNTFLRTVRENNPLSQRAENISAFGEFQRKAARGNFDPQLNSNVESKQFNSYHYFTCGNAELKQPLYTSQYLKVGYQYGQGAYLNPEKSTPSIGLPYIGLEASLLQGMMFDKRRAEVTKAKHYADFYTAEQKIQLNDLMFVASNVYVEALYARNVNSLYQYFADLADQRLKGISELSRVGEKPAIDTVEAAIFLQGRLLDRQAGDIEVIKKMNELRTLTNLGDAVSQTALNMIDSLQQVYYTALKNIQLTMVSDVNAHPLITQYNAKQKILETEQRLKREMIKPVLNVSYNFLNSSVEVVSPAFNAGNYKWGATFSFPLFLRKPRNEYKMAALETKNNTLETINKQNQLQFKRKYILEAIQITAGQIANAEKSVAYSKLLVEAERLKFMNGESSLFLLNSRENKWLETELKLAEYRLKILKSFIELTYVSGDLSYELQEL